MHNKLFLLTRCAFLVLMEACFHRGIKK